MSSDKSQEVIIAEMKELLNELLAFHIQKIKPGFLEALNNEEQETFSKTIIARNDRFFESLVSIMEQIAQVAITSYEEYQSKLRGIEQMPPTST